MNVIYRIRNIVDGTVYVGQSTVGTKQRWKTHKQKLNAGRHPNIHLQRAWNNYGSDKFVFDLMLQDIPEAWLDISERAWILFYSRTVGCYNLTTGGNKRKKFSDETKHKISLATQAGWVAGRIPWNKGRHTCTPEHKQALRVRMSGNKHASGNKWSKEARQKLSLRNMGNKYNVGHSCSDSAKRKISAANSGRSPSAETRLKMSKALSGRVLSVAVRKKMSLAAKSRWISGCSDEVRQHMCEGQQRRHSKEK